MNGRALALLAFVVIFGAAIGVYVINETPTAVDDEQEVRALVSDFGKKLQSVPLLADRTMVADAMSQHYAIYVSPTLLTKWQNDPTRAPGRTASSPWPDRIEITSLTEKGSNEFDVQGYVIEVTNEGGGIDEPPTEAVRRPVTLTIEKTGNVWRITDLSLGAYPGDGNWKYSETNAQGIQFMYPEKLPTTYITAEVWPPRVELVAGEYTCDIGQVEGADGPTATLETHKIGDRDYCVFTNKEGAAGSSYTTYQYSTAQGDFLAHVAFVLRTPQCVNYDDPQRSACTTEQANFDIDSLVDRIASSIRMQ